MPTKELIIVAGPNGSGKSTYIGQLLAVRAMPYYSADLIAKEFSNLDPASQQFAAGREFILRIERQLERHEDFVLETTMSGRTLQHFVRRTQAAGYHVSIYFIYVDSAQTSFARVKERVCRGGHDVPEADVFRCFNRCFTNFWRIYRKIADSWFIAYNFTGDFVRAASGEQDAIVVHDGNEFQRFLASRENQSMLKTNVSNETLRKSEEFEAIGQRAVHAAQEENRRLGIPNVYSINGVLYYELPNGELSREDPYQEPTQKEKP